MKVFAFVISILLIGTISRVDGLNRFIENFNYHEGEDADCKGTRMELNGQMKEVKCMPRKTLVKLRPQPGYFFFPSIVSVKRCDGLCGHYLSCMPIESINKPILVRRNYVQSKEFSCYRVYVEEHTKCKCGCNTMKNDCNEKQIYIEDDCACKCMNYEDQLECRVMKNMIWNPEKCKCTCIAREEECSTGLMWIPSLCRCAKVMMPTEDELRESNGL